MPVVPSLICFYCVVTLFNYFLESFFIICLMGQTLLYLFLVDKLVLTSLHRYLFSVYAGFPRYSSPYPAMVRPVFPPRPPGAVGVLPAVARPFVPGIPGVRPIISPIIRPAVVPIVTPADKPQTTVYVGKIAPTVENDFMLSLLQFCGPVKSWKRAQDPTTGTPKGFGFCEFESAEGVLRALRLLSKFNIDGQELVLNVNQATREYLERYVDKKMENANKTKETRAEASEKEDESAAPDGKTELPKPAAEEVKKDGDAGNKENIDIANSSPDRSRKYDRRSRDRDRERDVKREKEQEIERYEREAERERARKERELRRKIEDGERAYQGRLKLWERREREKEKERQYEKDREKERERKRKKEILYDEEEDDDDSRKRWHRSALEDKRKKRLREKEDDLADRLKEEEEIAEAKRKAEEEKLQQQQRDALRLLTAHEVNGSEETEESNIESKDKAVVQDKEGDLAHEKHTLDDGVTQNGTRDESTMATITTSDTQQGGSAPVRKLGFGLVGSGKRTAVPSVFHEEEEDEAHKDKRMRPLVPIDYSTEELQAVQPAASGAPPPNLVAAAEFAKRISNVNPRDEKPDLERERSRRSHDKSSHRDKDRIEEDNGRTRDEGKDKIVDRDKDRERGIEKMKAPDNKKLLDAKQLIDTIPKTKEELFSYEINWAIYDKHELHERMRPWISKKITEFLGEEETTLVDYIVSSTQEHVKASQMLELLQSILDEEAEMFVLKMWRMLIFEIKRVEVGLPLRSKT
ncbi:RNA-binding protein 25 [Carica papaya]|uniref:RNA-binding protein 25 n=1 Tax=Carica papaya TaxID=3649 RepID=UPI000B8CB4E8|nr:RNA-binding protein 25 [Carica papaya]